VAEVEPAGPVVGALVKIPWRAGALCFPAVHRLALCVACSLEAVK
jgi:hypothetical protein